MMKKLLSYLVLSLTLVVGSGVQATDKTVFLTSLEWPPYSGQSLPDGGASIKVAKAAFSAMGYELKVHFYPWTRAIKAAGNPDSIYAGYFPEYYSDSINKHFIYSLPMGQSPLALMENSLTPIYWRTIQDLSPYVIGTVHNYVNTREFDQRVAQGLQKTEAVISDFTNIQKVAAMRIPAAIIDENVFHYLIANKPSLKRMPGQVQINKRLLEKKDLYICFNRTPQGKYLASVYNQGLQKINIDALMSDYLQSFRQTSNAP